MGPFERQSHIAQPSGQNCALAELLSAARQRWREGSDAPGVHGELLEPGFDVSERSVSRSLRRLYPREQARKLRAARLRNHRDVIVATDFFTVPTLTFRVLYCLVRAPP